MTHPSRSGRRWPVSVLFVIAACSGGGGTVQVDPPSAIATPRATFALGDASAANLATLAITFHSLSLSGPGGSVAIVDAASDAPVTIDALAYVGSAAPFAGRALPAGEYDHLSFEITVAAVDQAQQPVTVHPLFDDTLSYEHIATDFPLGPRSFTVAAPADENQPFLFLHVDAEGSVTNGPTNDSIRFSPEIFLSTWIPMELAGTVGEVDATGGVFTLVDAKGATFRVQPTDCTAFVLGVDAGQSGTSRTDLFNGLQAGAVLQMDGFLGRDPGCDDAAQRAPFYHPRRIRGEFAAQGTTEVTGFVTGVAGTVVDLQVIAARDLTTAQGTTSMELQPGHVVHVECATAGLFAAGGQETDLTGSPGRLQRGEVLAALVREITAVGPQEHDATGIVANAQRVRISGMLGAVTADAMTIAGAGAKKDGGGPFPATVHFGDGSFEFGGDVVVERAVGSYVHVGPLAGWTLDQVVDANYDNQLALPDQPDGQQLGNPGNCGDENDADLDIDAATLVAFVDHRSDASDVWVVHELDVAVSADATQKYVAWYSGTPACTLPSNGSWNNNACIATSGLHRDRIVLGNSSAPGWVNLAQSGAGRFGTAVLNAGARVPGATVPSGSDTAGWDDVNRYLLVGLDFDGDMYPFDAIPDSCVGLSELAWLDLSQAQFTFFQTDTNTGNVDFRYLTTYDEFKAAVIALQDAQQGSCGPGTHRNSGFDFTGVIDKASLGSSSVPVIRCVSGQVFDGGCVPN